MMEMLRQYLIRIWLKQKDPVDGNNLHLFVAVQSFTSFTLTYFSRMLISRGISIPDPPPQAVQKKSRSPQLKSSLFVCPSLLSFPSPFPCPHPLFFKVEPATLTSQSSSHSPLSNQQKGVVGLFVLILISILIFAINSSHKAHEEDHETRTTVLGQWKKINEMGVGSVPNANHSQGRGTETAGGGDGRNRGDQDGNGRDGDMKSESKSFKSYRWIDLWKKIKLIRGDRNDTS